MAPLSPGAPVKRSRAHPNVLVNAFAPLLEFAPELESALPPENPEALRTRLLEELVRAATPRWRRAPRWSGPTRQPGSWRPCSTTWR